MKYNNLILWNSIINEYTFLSKILLSLCFLCFWKNLNKKLCQDHDCIWVYSFRFLLSQAGIIAVKLIMALGNIHRKVSEIRLVLLCAFLQLVCFLAAVRQSVFLSSIKNYLWILWRFASLRILVSQFRSHFIVVGCNIDWGFVLFSVKVPERHYLWVIGWFIEWLGYFYNEYWCFPINTLSY